MSWLFISDWLFKSVYAFNAGISPSFILLLQTAAQLILESIYWEPISFWMGCFGMLENTLWQGINSGFHPIPLIGWRSLSLSAKWLSSLLVQPCFPPILHTRAWDRESDTSEERWRRTMEMEGETNSERRQQRWRQKEGRGTRWSISQRNPRRSGPAPLP